MNKTLFIFQERVTELRHFFFKSAGRVERLSQNKKFSERQRKEPVHNLIPLKQHFTTMLGHIC